MPNQKQPAVLLIAHGSKRNEANAELEQIAAKMRERLPGTMIQHSYLELAEPTIPQGAAQCVNAGATEVVLLPYFLSLGNHVVNDLERFRQQFETEYPKISFQVAPPLGSHPLMIDILIDRFAAR